MLILQKLFSCTRGKDFVVVAKICNNEIQTSKNIKDHAGKNVKLFKLVDGDLSASLISLCVFFFNIKKNDANL